MRKLRSGEYFTLADWKVSLHTNGKTGQPDWQRLIREIWHKLESPERILKHDHRSSVGVFRLDNDEYVVKKFTLQNTWLWFQVTSVLFPTLGEITCRNGLRLAADGFLTPKPVMLLQRFRHGMVKDSWLIYPFLEGQLLTVEDDTEIVDYVKRLHKAGWVHRDPHPANFLRTDKGIAMLDPIRAKRSKSRYLQAYDIMLMSHDMPAASDIYGWNDLGPWYRLAQAGHNLVRFYRGVKYIFRALLRINDRTKV